MPMTPFITITTDLGDNFAVSQLKAVIFALGFTGQIIENHDVSSFSIVEGAYGIWQLVKYCPQNTIHVGIVDPGVGSERNGIVIKTNNFWFVGPDNGLFWEAASQDGILQSWKIDESYFGSVSTTFHGRDVFVKIAVLLSENKYPEDFGCRSFKNIKKLEFKNGQVLHIDNYGNAKIFGNKTFDLPVVKAFSDVNPGQPLILNGSSDLLELAVNLKSAKDYFGLKLGQVIQHL
jgi:S-adenosylmethionine hydrolase